MIERIMHINFNNKALQNINYGKILMVTYCVCFQGAPVSFTTPS